MNAWARSTGKSGYAEWFPELDLLVASRWESSAEEAHPGHEQEITRVDFVAEQVELGETA